MKRILPFFVSLIFTVAATAQQPLQDGYVKTKGVLRPNGSVVPGIRMPGVTIGIRGTNKVVSRQDGTFSFTPPAQTFYLSGITKQDYVLADPDALKRAYSQTKVPMEIVIENVRERRKELAEARESISKSMNKQIRLRQEEIARLSEQNRITQAERDSLQGVLEMLLEANESRLPTLALYFVSTDYDNVDEKRRQINAFILNGQFDKADSVINTKGDLDLRLEMTRKREAMNNSEKADLAEDYYSKFIISSSKFERESAYRYLKERATLDTLNVEWQLTAGMYAEDDIADYDAAYNYIERGIRVATMQKNAFLLSEAYNDMGALFTNLGHYDKALDYYGKALEQAQTDTTLQYRALKASIYDNMATAYSDGNMFSESREYHQKALEMKRMVYGEMSEGVCISLINTGALHSRLKEFQESLDCFLKAKEIAEKLYSPEDPTTAHICNGLGICYSNMGRHDEAIASHMAALGIRRKAFGDNHPSLAITYNNIGTALLKTGDYSRAKECFENAARVWIAAYGEDNSRLIPLYGNIGSMYEALDNLANAIYYYEEAARIASKLYGSESRVTEEVLPSLYLALESMAKQSPTDENKKKLETFMANKLPACRVVSGGPAAVQGLKGKYAVMEYCGWVIDNSNAMFHLVEPTTGKPKDMVLMHDGEIGRYHFEDRIGVQWVLWIVSAEKKQEMLEEYRKWKKGDLHE